MIVTKAIYNILSNHAGLTALVSTRIYPVVAAQQAAFPYVVIDIDRTSPVNRMIGRARMQQIYITVSAFSKRFDEACDIAVQINTALDRVTPGTYGGVVIQGIIHENETAGLQDEDDVYFIPIEFKVNLTTGIAA